MEKAARPGRDLVPGSVQFQHGAAGESQSRRQEGRVAVEPAGERKKEG